MANKTSGATLGLMQRLRRRTVLRGLGFAAGAVVARPWAALARSAGPTLQDIPVNPKGGITAAYAVVGHRPGAVLSRDNLKL